MSVRIDDTFIQLINDHIGVAHKICRAYFPDVHDQNDMLQEMMYQLWRSYPRFDNRSKFSTWMYSVCLNTALTYQRKRVIEKTVSLSMIDHEIPEQIPVNKDDMNALLFRAIATLNAVNKAVILLYLEDLSYEEIAHITGLTKSNVSVRLVRIKKELELLLKEKN